MARARHLPQLRVILPDTTTLADYLLDKTATLIDRLLVYPARMLRNLELTGGLVFSGQLLLELAEAGMSREDAYKLVQGHAMAAWNDPAPNAPTYRARLAAGSPIPAPQSPEKLAPAFA